MTNIPRLRELREFHGVTRAQLAAAIEVHDRTIIRWEMHGGDPNLTDLRRIATFFNVSVAYLIGESSKVTIFGATSPFASRGLTQFVTYRVAPVKHRTL